MSAAIPTTPRNTIPAQQEAPNAPPRAPAQTRLSGNIIRILHAAGIPRSLIHGMIIFCQEHNFEITEEFPVEILLPVVFPRLYPYVPDEARYPQVIDDPLSTIIFAPRVPLELHFIMQIVCDEHRLSTTGSFPLEILLPIVAPHRYPVVRTRPAAPAYRNPLTGVIDPLNTRIPIQGIPRDLHSPLAIYCREHNFPTNGEFPVEILLPVVFPDLYPAYVQDETPHPENPDPLNSILYAPSVPRYLHGALSCYMYDHNLMGNFPVEILLPVVFPDLYPMNRLPLVAPAVVHTRVVNEIPAARIDSGWNPNRIVEAAPQHSETVQEYARRVQDENLLNDAIQRSLS